MVSVCLASRNGEKFIKQQVASILCQLKDEDELIISDDGSADRTIEIINSIQDPRIKLVFHQTSGRPTENFQNALNNAKGDYIFLSDQDDVWLPGKYEKQLEQLNHYDLVVNDSIVVDENLQQLYPSFFLFHYSKKGVLRNLIKNAYFGSCMAFRKSLLQWALPFPKSREIGHDVWLGLVAEMTGKVVFMKEPLILYRRHSSAATAYGIGKSSRSLLAKVLGRLTMLFHAAKFYVAFICKWKKG